jgi:hypothetical protein
MTRMVSSKRTMSTSNINLASSLVNLTRPRHKAG